MHRRKCELQVASIEYYLFYLQKMSLTIRLQKYVQDNVKTSIMKDAFDIKIM